MNYVVMIMDAMSGKYMYMSSMVMVELNGDQCLGDGISKYS
jgi:hypothetical protein